jgi:hypothetical protein
MFSFIARTNNIGRDHCENLGHLKFRSMKLMFRLSMFMKSLEWFLTKVYVRYILLMRITNRILRRRCFGGKKNNCSLCIMM